LYANTTTLPGMLQALFGYDATKSGLVLSPAGIFAVMMLFVVGALLTRGMDARYLIAAGLVTIAAGNFWMSRMNLEISPWQVVWPRVVMIIGLSMVFAPLNVAAFLYMPKELRPAAVGLMALLRNEGGSVGTSVGKIIVDRREQFHTLRVNEALDPLNSTVQQFAAQGQEFFTQHFGDPAGAQQMTLQTLKNVRDQQALSLAYFDVFWALASASAALVVLVFFMRRSVAEKGAHIAAE
jgi:DHA2 family multidrug resistance protein